MQSRRLVAPPALCDGSTLGRPCRRGVPCDTTKTILALPKEQSLCDSRRRRSARCTSIRAVPPTDGVSIAEPRTIDRVYSSSPAIIRARV